MLETSDQFVILPETYRAKFAHRPELARYLHRIHWVSDQNAALALASGAVIALPPSLQSDTISLCLSRPNVKVLFLEKPIAVSPASAMLAVTAIERARTRYRVGYTFLYTDWFNGIRPIVQHACDELLIDWRFMAHHFAHGRDNWKGRHSEGGGVLRFFSVHLLAMLAKLGYDEATRSCVSGTVVDFPERWEAHFSGKGLTNAHVYVDTRCATTSFQVAVRSERDRRTLVDLPDPFAHTQSATLEDRRVPILKRLLASIDESDDVYQALYGRVNLLWLQTETITECVYARSADEH